MAAERSSPPVRTGNAERRYLLGQNLTTHGPPGAP